MKLQESECLPGLGHAAENFAEAPAFSAANAWPLRINASTLRGRGASVMKMSFKSGYDSIQSIKLSMNAAAQPSNSGARC